MPPGTLLLQHHQRSRTRLRRFSVAVGATALAIAVTKVFGQELGSAGSYLPSLLAVLVSAIYGGLGPAMLSQLLGASAVLLLVANPLTFPIRPVDLYSFLAFLIVATLVLLVTVCAHRERLEAIVRAAHDSLWEWDFGTQQVWRSGNLQDIFGLPGPEVVNDISWWRERLHPDDSERVWDSIRRVIASRKCRWSEEYRIRQESGSYLPVADHAFVVRDGAGRAKRMVGEIADISARKDIEEQLLHQAFHDALTGLPNREMFLNRLEQAGSRLHHPLRNSLAVLFLDVDRFKVVNDSLGHGTGDALLAAIAARLSHCLRPGDMAARFGGDELAILLDGIQSVDEARHIADRIQDLLTPPFEISGHCIVITASIGIALVDLNKPEEALRHADIAMYRAKNGGKARHEVFEPSVDTHAMDQLQLESDLRDGLKDGSFRMYYQPIVCLQTGAVESFEALLRWHHPRRGILLPSEFLSVAEEAGLALQLGDLVLRQSCNHLRAWRRHRSVHSRLRTNVNLSSKQFANPLVVDEFHQVLEDAELDGDALTIELTEGIIMENRALAAEKLRRLRDLGVTLAIDDFGTGYSSLARLQDFPITALKVDASFVSKITEGRPQIFDAIIALANELKLEVTAEGIETAEQFSYVKKSGAAKCQGLFLSEAMTAEAAEQMLTTEPPWMSFFREHVTEKPKKGFVARAPR